MKYSPDGGAPLPASPVCGWCQLPHDECRCNDDHAEPECDCKPGDRLADCPQYLAAKIDAEVAASVWNRMIRQEEADR